MSSGIPPANISVCNNRDEHNDLYREAEEKQDAFFVIDEKDSGYSVTYDLLPTGHHLTDEATEELQDRVSHEIEAILTDAELPTDELGHGVGDTLGNAFFFEREQTARDFASMVSRIVLDENNWEEDLTPREVARREAGIDDVDDA